ncbi:MAG: hypothetical protein IKY39_01420 [Clostridia bacterium]|nr:hypothetical protein [Clostridia bacterium]
MNILTDALPDFVAVGNVKYKVNTDFRIWMEFERVIQNTDTSAKDKVMMILRLCLDSERLKALPEDVLSIMGALKKFYLRDKENKATTAKKQDRALDFAEDSGYIYSAFLTQYGIDLLSIPYMHWYVFCALLEGLEETREFVKIMRFRVCDPDKEHNTEKRKYLKRMKEFYALADLRSESEKEEDIAKVLLEVF